mgnify:CR=1 FL=1
MRAIHVDETGAHWTERERVRLGRGEVRVNVRASAITGLDRDVVAGRLGFVGTPGHTFVGQVVEVDDPEFRPLIGRRVVPRGGWGCGRCDACVTGLGERCGSPRIPGVRGAHGGHAEQIVLPARAVAPLDDVLTDEAGVLLPITAAILDTIPRADMPEWTNVLVVGDGGAGLLAGCLLSAAGYTVTLHGRHGDRFDLLRRYRVNFVLVADDSETAWTTGRLGPTPMRYPVVVDASGTPDGWQTCLDLVTPGGHVLMMSSASDGIPRPVERVQEKGVTVLGVRQGPLEPAMAILASGHFDPTSVIRRVDSFDDALAAYDRAAQTTFWMSLLRMVEPIDP